MARISTLSSPARQFTKKTAIDYRSCVKRFLDALPSCSFVGNLGRGRGGNFTSRTDLTFVGDGVVERDASCVSVPIRSGCLDAVVSVGLLDHFTCPLKRIHLIEEIVRSLRRGGKAFVSVRASGAKEYGWRSLGNQDFLVPAPGNHTNTAYEHRHLFDDEELQELLLIFEGRIEIDDIAYEMGTWCVAFTKIG
jgi:SAM-dependent methyltransferase